MTTSGALTGHRAEFVLRNVPPAASLRRVAELDPLRQLPRPRQLARSAERSPRVLAETVKHQPGPLACGTAALRRRGHFGRLVRFLGHRLHECRGSPVRPARPETREGFRDRVQRTPGSGVTPTRKLPCRALALAESSRAPSSQGQPRPSCRSAQTRPGTQRARQRPLSSRGDRRRPTRGREPPEWRPATHRDRCRRPLAPAPSPRPGPHRNAT